MKNLQKILEKMMDKSQYEEAGDLALKKLGAELIYHGSRFDSHSFDKDGQKRYIIDCEIKRGEKSYRFDFGTSVKNSCVEESEWDVLNEDDFIEIFAGISIQGKDVYGSSKFSVKKSEIDNLDQVFIEDKANEIVKSFNDSLSYNNNSWKDKFKNGTISRNLMESKMYDKSIKIDEAIPYVQRAIRKKINDLKENLIMSKTKSLPKPTMPRAYDIITALTWYDPEDFENFCSVYGYDEDSRSAEKIYNAVVKEYNGLKELFTQEEMDALSVIS